MKHIIFTVTNDLSLDQRMDRICSALTAEGFRCTLVGRKLKTSIELTQKPYQQHRIQCLFETGKVFYLEYNLRLFFYLLRHKADVYCGIDLDTCLPSYAAAQRWNKPFVFDSHEYFSELEEVVTRPIVHAVWQKIEAFIMRRAKTAYTISDGYAKLFKDRYNTEFKVIRNVPVYEGDTYCEPSEPRHLIYQGALNIGRGLEASILAMQSLAPLELYIYGDGPLKPSLEKLIQSENLGQRVFLKGPVSPDKLRNITRKAWAGLTLFSGTGLHHQHSLANRFFDYFHAGIPQITIAHEEYKRFNQDIEVAVLIQQGTSELIVSAVKTLQEEATYNKLRANCPRAAQAHNWQQESIKLTAIYRTL